MNSFLADAQYTGHKNTTQTQVWLIHGGELDLPVFRARYQILEKRPSHQIINSSVLTLVKTTTNLTLLQRD